MKSHPTNTSWQKEGKWYHESVGERGHYYHEHVVLPGVTRLLNVKGNDTLLDLGCGQGVLSRRLPSSSIYVGVDSASSLISQAKSLNKFTNHRFIVGDATKPLSLPLAEFSHAVIILALQNMEHPEGAIDNVSRYLKKDGTFVIVLNHPAFRIPRQSSWGIDEQSKLQYRRMNRYMSPLKIPISMHPGKSPSSVTWSFHRPISHYSTMLQKSGFLIELIEEWTSDKESEGANAKMENRGRSEFPLFLAIKAVHK